MYSTSRRIIAAIALIPAAVGLTLATPASAAPDLGHQVCSVLDQQGASLRTFLTIESQLIQKAGLRSAQAVEAVKESVSNDCPKYQAAWAEADREAGIENQHINGNY